MKKTIEQNQVSEMRSEYDFSNGIRGKHYASFRNGHTVKIIKKSGKPQLTYFTQKEGSIMLDPDIQKHFHSSKSVNNALREYITMH
jgi:hypothetical protein